MARVHPRDLLLVLMISACTLAACTPPPYYPPRAPAPQATPAGIEHRWAFFQGLRGTQIFEQSWRPQAPKAAFAIVHGLKDHGNRYEAFAERLAQRGYAVHAIDLRGHAHSEGARVWVDSFDDYLADLEVFLKRARARDPGAPLFLFGHSMGGAIAARYVITHKPKLDGLVLSAAALEVDVSPLKVGGTKVMAALAADAGVFQLDLDDFSRDPAVVRACGDDPLVYQEPAPAQTARELLNAIDATEQRMEEVELPLLVLHGTADKVTPPKGSQDLYRRARSRDKTIKLYPGLYHDLLHEPEKGVVMEDIAAWLDRHVTAAAR